MMAVAAAQKNREMFAIKKSFSIENGYQARRRSLIDERIDAVAVKQNKHNDTSLENCILQAQGEHHVPQEEKIEFKSDQDIENAQIPDEDIDGSLPDGDDHSADENEGSSLTEDEIVLAHAAGQSAEAENAMQCAALVARLRNLTQMATVFGAIATHQGTVVTFESRQSRAEGVEHDVLVKVEMTRGNLLKVISALRQAGCFASLSLLEKTTPAVEAPWFPKHASELDDCNHLMTKYEPELDMNHPGFADKVYRQRRKEIAEIAFGYKFGDPIPYIPYTDVENKTWRSVFRTVLDLNPKHACAEYRTVFKKLQDEKIFTEERIPQLEEMSAFLRRNTGFTLRPAAGLLTARDFLASLAFRIFQSTQYVRHVNSPYHTPEPDCIHEILGHMPLLADPAFAQFSQEIGLASLGASDDEIEKLSTVYWFTVEFGLCKEQGQVKAYGAGLLSSYGELLHAISDKPEHRDFEPASTAVQTYQDQEYQPIYYVAESFEDAKEKFRRWVSTMSRPFEVRFNPHTGCVEVLDSVEKLDTLVHQLNTELIHLSNAISKIRSH